MHPYTLRTYRLFLQLVPERPDTPIEIPTINGLKKMPAFKANLKEIATIVAYSANDAIAIAKELWHVKYPVVERVGYKYNRQTRF